MSKWEEKCLGYSRGNCERLTFSFFSFSDVFGTYLLYTCITFLQELKEYSTIVVSGHHGKLHIDGLRLIIDEGGGYEHMPVAAMILPSMKLVRDIDCA